MSLTQIVGAVLVSLSVAYLLYLGVVRFAASVLADLESERCDLDRASSPCTQTFTRYQR